jgi:hypothetical protein
MRTLGLFLLLLVFIAGGLFYTVFINFSEHREYTGKSLDYYILTPSELSQMSELCIDRPSFIYNADDGPKPTIVVMNCTIELEGAEKYLKTKGLIAKGHGIYKDEDIEVQMTINQGREKVTSVVMLVQI